MQRPRPRTLFLLPLLSVLHSAVCHLPEDLKPRNTYTTNDTKHYVAFNGRASFDKTPGRATALEYTQGIKKMGSDYVIHARDNIFVVDPLANPSETGDIPYKQVLYWPSDNTTTDLCGRKGQSAEQCHNYVKLFEPLNGRDGDRAIACGTYSFNAKCKYFKRDDSGRLSHSTQDYPGTLKCPFSPDSSVASIVADRNLYTALKSGYSGDDSLIHRSSVSGGNDTNLRTVRNDVAWLNDPRFIRFVDGGRSFNKMFVFFTETAVEDKAHRTYSRCGQACKNDQGGSNALRSQFTSFFKVTLNCSLPGRPPFYFREMSDVTDFVTLRLGHGVSRPVRVVFAVMNTPRNSLPASAICAFTENDLEEAFSGPFMEHFMDKGRMYWDKQSIHPTPHLPQCGKRSGQRQLSNAEQTFAKKHPLMYRGVKAWNTTHRHVRMGHDASPIFTRLRSGVFLTSIDVDADLGSAAKTMLIVGTEGGKILKIIVDNGARSTSLLEEREVFNAEKCGTNKAVRKVHIDKEIGRLMVVFQDCVVAAPLCAVRTDCRKTCESSGDPHCVWRDRRCESVTTDYRASPSRPDDDDEGNCPVEATAGKGAGGTQEVHGPEKGHSETTAVPKTKSSAANCSGVIPEERVNAAGGSWLLPAVMGCLIGLVLALVFFFLWYCCFRKSKGAKAKEANLKMKSLSNGSVKNKRDSRRESTQSNGRQKSRHPSGNSNGRQVNQRGSVHERQRNPTECSVGTGGEEDLVFSVGGDPIQTPDTPSGKEGLDGRSRQLMSTTSSQGGRRKTRNSKQSTSSAPENYDEKRSPDEHPYNGMLPSAGDETSSKPGSNDSGHALDGFGPHMEPELYFQPGPKQKPTVLRAMSFQGPRTGPSPFNRTYSMDQPRSVTMSHPRSVRSIVRQGSMQAGQVAHPGKYPGPHPYSTMTPQGQPPTTWAQTGPPGSQQNPRLDKRMTHSLDRKQLLKGQSYQPVPGEIFPEDQAMGPPPKAYPPQRKRNVSESAAGSVPSHLAMHPYYQPIQEDAPLLSPLHEEGPQAEFRMPTKRMNLPIKPHYLGGDPPPIGDFPQTGYYPGPQSGQGFVAKLPYDPGMVAPSARPNLRLHIPRSTPGTPLSELPPTFDDSPSHVTTMPIASKMRRSSLQRGIPNDGQQRLSGTVTLANGFPIGQTPSKSDPSSPQDNAAEPTYPSGERMRHVSGNSNPSQRTPSSPSKPFPPTNFGSMTQQPPMSAGVHQQRGRHFSGPGENQKIMNGNNNNNMVEPVKKPTPTTISPGTNVLVAPKEFT